jgi:glycosyltransferase involved in cell wall biosynthesis
MTHIPKVSVILPTYNRAHLLERAAQSVLQQSFKNLELIIVDDNSQDNTQEVVDNLNDPRVSYIKHHHNQGGSAARNTGIKASSGSYIAFQDSDDEWLWGKLQQQVDLLDESHENIGVIYTGFLQCNKRNTKYIPHEKNQTIEINTLHNLLLGNFISTQTLVVKKECLEKSGYFDENLPRFQDWELVIRLAKNVNFKLIDEPLVAVHSTPGNITSNESVRLKALELIYEKHVELFNAHTNAKALFLFNMGHIAAAEGDTRKGVRCYLKAIQTDATNLTFYFALLLTPIRRHIISIKHKLKSLRLM